MIDSSPMRRSYPVARPAIGTEEKRAVRRVLDSGTLSIGPCTEEFERSFARYNGTKYAVAVSSGTAGLHLALIAAGIGKGDEVITSPFSFVASANSILYVNAKPVFVDIDPLSYNMDPAKIERSITKQTRAILVVHIFGQSCDMTAIMQIAKKHKLAVIEDACESVGTCHRNKMVGTFGASAVYAFYANKQMTTGEGGMLVTNSKKTHRLVKSLRNQGRAPNMQWLDHDRLGYNYRIDEMSAALGVEQLKKLPAAIRERQRIASWYAKHLAPHGNLVRAPHIASGNTHTFFVYVVELLGNIKRDEVIRRLAKKGVATKPYLPSIHLFSFYRRLLGTKRGDFPTSEHVSDHALALPIYRGLTENDVRRIVELLIQTV